MTTPHQRRHFSCSQMQVLNSNYTALWWNHWITIYRKCLIFRGKKNKSLTFCSVAKKASRGTAPLSRGLGVVDTGGSSIMRFLFLVGGTGGGFGTDWKQKKGWSYTRRNKMSERRLSESQTRSRRLKPLRFRLELFFSGVCQMWLCDWESFEQCQSWFGRLFWVGVLMLVSV